MTITTRTALLLTALLCLAGAAAAFPIPAARIVRAEGEVRIRYAGTEDFVSVWRGEKAGPGDTIATGPGGVMEMRFSDGTRVVLGPSGSLTVSSIAPRHIAGIGKDGRKIVLDITVTLLSGRLRAAVGPGPLFVVSVGAAYLVSAPATGVDFTCAADIAAPGCYLRVHRGCAFLPRDDASVFPVCAGSSVTVQDVPGGAVVTLVPDPYGDSAALAFTGETPVITGREEVVSTITVDGTETAGKDGLFFIPKTAAGKRKALAIGGTTRVGYAVLISPDNGASWVTVAPDGAGRWRYALGRAPEDGLPLVIKTVGTGLPPADLAAVVKRAPAGPVTETSTAKEEKIDPDAVASRFVPAFSGALSRGDTGALSVLVSPDYNGAAGGAGRSALLAGVSEFFRAGGTLTVSAYVSTASLTEGAVIVTMSFSSRVNGAPKSGVLRLWLTADGMLTHAEGDWVL